MHCMYEKQKQESKKQTKKTKQNKTKQKHVLENLKSLVQYSIHISTPHYFEEIKQFISWFFPFFKSKSYNMQFRGSLVKGMIFK